MTISLLTFDLDDTLWDVTPVLQQAEQELHEWLAERFPRLTESFDVHALRGLRQELAASRPELRHNVTDLRKTALRHAAQLTGYSPELAEPAFAVFIEARNRVTLYDDVEPVLKRLHERFRLGVLTDGNADIQRIGLGHLFEFTLSAEQVGVSKPDPAIFQAACQRSGVAPSEIVHIGDHANRDVAGAAAAGLRTVWINRDKAPWPGAPPAPVEIASLFELEAALEPWTGSR